MIDADPPSSPETTNPTTPNEKSRFATGRNSTSPRVVAWSLVADVVSVLVFVTIGRRNHDEGLTPGGIIETATPFLAALASTWLIALVWRRPLGIREGVATWIGTVALGMALRRFVFDEGTATAFVIVATVFLAALLNGWRALARRWCSGEVSSPPGWRNLTRTTTTEGS